jgi:hypothetical protein
LVACFLVGYFLIKETNKIKEYLEIKNNSDIINVMVEKFYPKKQFKGKCMKISKCQKALVAVAILGSLSSAALLAAPVSFGGATVVSAATTDTLDFAKINAALAKYNALVEADYTATSWKTLQDTPLRAGAEFIGSMVSEMKALTKDELADRIKENGGTVAGMQSQLNVFADALNQGIDTLLVKKSELVSFNFTAIKAAIARYNGLKAADYTPESWAAFQASLVYSNGEAFSVPEYAKNVADLEALTPDEVVYFLRETGLTAAEIQNELDHNAAALNDRMDLLVAGSTAQSQKPLANTGTSKLPTTSAPAGSVAKTNKVKATSVTPLALLAVSSLTVLGSVGYKLRKEN